MSSSSHPTVSVKMDTKIKESETGISMVKTTKTAQVYPTKTTKKSYPVWKILLGGLVALALVGGLIGTIVYFNLQPTPRELQWWHKTTIYQIYPRSFQDSNGDGLGDLNGITQRLPYLKKLGIETIWLSPFFKSPMADFGYDVADFTAVDPIFGTMDDFDNLMKQVKELKLRLILDFVPNHSSNESEWFENSVHNMTKFRDFYIWHDGHTNKTAVGPDGRTIKAVPNNWISVFGGSAWEWHPIRQQYYYHAFLVSQPDLNWRNPLVKAAMDDVLTFWLDKGVDGFRIDAIPFLYEIPVEEMVDANEDQVNKWLPEDANPLDYDYWSHPFSRNLDITFQQPRHWTKLMNDYVAKNGGDSKFLILEVMDKNTTVIEQYYPEDPFGTGTTPFYMGLVTVNSQTNGTGIDELVKANYASLPAGAWPNWVIGNHDQRRATDKLGSPEFIDGLNMLNLLLPGIPTTYYGEEIGMLNAIFTDISQVKDPAALHPDYKDTWQTKTRDYCRSPMQWNTSTSAGFSSNPNTWLPLAPGWNETINVEYQSRPESNETHYSVFKDLIRIRRTPAFQSREMRTALVTADIYSFIRESSDQTYLIAIDLRRDASAGMITYDFTPAQLSGSARVVTASVNLFPKNGAAIVPDSIAAYGKDRDIDLRRVPLIPASAVVLRLTTD